MTKLLNPLKRLSAPRRPASAPSRVSRRGSVLILVIALLVLMALIGTAFITTATTDRQASSQHTNNTQIELLVQGVVNAVQSKIGGALVVGSTSEYRANAAATRYDHWTGIALDRTDARMTPSGSWLLTAPGDGYLASRVPGKIDSPTDVAWQFISASPISTNSATQFESPYNGTSAGTGGGVGHGGMTPYGARDKAIPTWIDLPLPGGQGTQRVPALVVATTPNGGSPKVFVAADADGDGIADAGLFRLPIGNINGLTYYAAVRIIDNNSAVNAAIAWRPNTNGYWPTNVDLEGMLTPAILASDMNKLNTYRRGPAITIQTEVWGDDTDGDGKGEQRGDSTLFKFETTENTVKAGDPLFAYWTQCGRRLDNPGFNTMDDRYAGLPISESMAIANRFCVFSASSGGSVIEGSLSQTTSPAVSRRFYPHQVPDWFALFNYTPASGTSAVPVTASLRALLTARNAVTNFAPGKRAGDTGSMPGFVKTEGPGSNIGEWYVAGDQAYMRIGTGASSGPKPENLDIEWTAMPWRTHPVRINVNTATYGQLLAAYWAVLSGSDGWADADGPGTRQFKTPGRDEGSPLNRSQTVKLRAAIAAVNTIDLRDPDNDVTSRNVNLGNGTEATVYGTERQPYITESIVVIHTLGDLRYVAIELHNPHSDDISLTGWKLATRDSLTGTLTELIPDLGTVVTGGVPQNGFVVLESSKSEREGAIPDGKLNMTGTPIEEPKLKQVLGDGNNELVLLRPRRADGAASQGTAVYNTFNENTVTDLVPADQLNYQGIKWPETGNVDARYRYARATEGIEGDPTSAAWHCVYGGPFNRNEPTDAKASQLHQVGWIREESPAGVSVPPGGIPSGGPAHGYAFKIKGNLGKHKKRNPDLQPAVTADKRIVGDTYDAGKNDPIATYRTRLLQVAAKDTGGTYKSQTEYPFGYFGRNGDILQVTFVGSYRINLGKPDYISVSMDAAFGHDGDKNGADPETDDNDPADAQRPLENIGRFCPISKSAEKDPRQRKDDFAYYDAYTEGIADGAIKGGMQTPNRYAFALRLFDFLTMQSPQQDFLPDIDPNANPEPLAPASSPKWAGSTPTPVPNGPNVIRPADANKGTEDSAGTEGLININTAPWRVLATVPFFPSSEVGGAQLDVARAANIAIAQDIVRYRDVDDGSGNPHGPFRSIYDLCAIVDTARFPGMAAAQAAGKFPKAAQGDLSPLNGDDRVAGGFEEQYLMMTRVSNMVTTRSDSFTAYVLVQGWRGAGTDKPELVVQRRSAAIVDRSTLKPNPNGAAKSFDPITMTVVPQN